MQPALPITSAPAAVPRALRRVMVWLWSVIRALRVMADPRVAEDAEPDQDE